MRGTEISRNEGRLQRDLEFSKRLRHEMEPLSWRCAPYCAACGAADKAFAAYRIYSLDQRMELRSRICASVGRPESLELFRRDDPEGDFTLWAFWADGRWWVIQWNGGESEGTTIAHGHGGRAAMLTRASDLGLQLTPP